MRSYGDTSEIYISPGRERERQREKKKKESEREKKKERKRESGVRMITPQRYISGERVCGGTPRVRHRSSVLPSIVRPPQ